jgi:nifR3 family TIM-barrel protein
MQLYPLDAYYAGLAAKIISDEGLADHIDINFGCPVKKVTSNGGGSAIPWKLDLYRSIIKEIVQNAGGIPVSAKFRIGLDDEHITYLDAGRIAVEEGVSAVTLHARTTKQYYSGSASWEHIKDLKEYITAEVGDQVKVFGNGDIWGAEDAEEMLRTTGVDGVAIGRGAIGRPWIFKELAEYFLHGEYTPHRPDLGEVEDVMLQHLRMLIEYIDVHDPNKPSPEMLGIRYFRSFIGPYLKGFPTGGNLKMRLMLAKTYSELEDLLRSLPQDLPYPIRVENMPRGRTKSAAKVHLPQGWLESR